MLTKTYEVCPKCMLSYYYEIMLVGEDELRVGGNPIDCCQLCQFCYDCCGGHLEHDTDENCHCPD